jgi:L-ascorbate metabolism protein UlaG (beta-lactamase superfamily)
MKAKTLIAAAVLAAFAATAQAHDRDDDDRDGWKRVDAAVVAARQKFFGVENVDARTGRVAGDKVIFSWLTNTTYAVSVSGRIVLLDSFATRLEVTPGRTNFVIKDMVDLKPEAIFLGHGHGDHADNAAYIAAKTGAHIYASQETCPVMQHDLARMKASPLIQNDPVARIDPAATIQCTDVTTTGSVPGTQLVRLRALEPEVCILGFRHLHSVLVPRDPDFPRNETPVTVDPRDATLFPVGTRLTPFNPPLPGQMDLRTGIGFSPNPGGPVAIAFQFVLRDEPHFTFLWQNSGGALKEGRGNGWNGTPEDGARLVALFRSLPQTDVLLGPVSTGNYPNNELRDIVMYKEALRPKIFVPGHHTTGTIGAEGSSAPLYVSLLKQLEIMEAPVNQWPGYPRSAWPDIRWATDPTDYARPVAFDPDAKAWRGGDWEKRARVRHFCGRGRD